jgi:hypothetical protein
VAKRSAGLVEGKLVYGQLFICTLLQNGDVYVHYWRIVNILLSRLVEGQLFAAMTMNECRCTLL